MCKTQIVLGRSCRALVILLAIVNVQPGGCIRITSSVVQERKQLSIYCTLWHKNEAAEGLIIFLCKDKSWDCSPETSLNQLWLTRDPKVDGASEKTSHLVFTINQVSQLYNGTYQCCARDQKSKIHLQGHFFSVLVTDTGNYRVTGLKQRQHPDVWHSSGTLSSGSLQVKFWVMLVTILVALQAP